MRLIFLLLWLTNLALAESEYIVIVHPKSTLENITSQSLKNLFLSKTRYLPDGSRAYVAEANINELKNDFYKDIAKKSELELRAYWATMIFSGNGKPPRQFQSSIEVCQYIKETPGSIAYVQRDSLLDGVKVLKVEQ